MAHPLSSSPHDNNNESTGISSDTVIAGPSQLPPRFSDIKFTTIGQQPALLNRFSTQDQERRFSSPTPSVASETGRSSPEMKTTPIRSRPSLLESLGGLTHGDASPSGDDTAIDSPSSDMDISLIESSPLKPSKRQGFDIFKPVLPFPSSQHPIPPPLSLLAPNSSSASRRGSSPVNPDLLYPLQSSTPIVLREVPQDLQAMARASTAASATKGHSIPLNIESMETSIQALYARLHSSLTQISPRNLTPPHLMVRTCQEGAVRSVAAAQKAHTAAQQSLELAKDHVRASQENLIEAENLQMRVDELAGALDFQSGQEEHDWEVKENMSSIEHDLHQFVTLVGQYEAERESRERELDRREKEIEDRLAILNAMNSAQSVSQITPLPIVVPLKAVNAIGTTRSSAPSRSSSPLPKRVLSSRETAEMEADAARLAWALEGAQIQSHQSEEPTVSFAPQQLSPSLQPIKRETPLTTRPSPAPAMLGSSATLTKEDPVVREETLRKQQAERKAQMAAQREAELREEQERKRKQVAAAKLRATNETAARIIAERENQKKLTSEALGSHNISSPSAGAVPLPEAGRTMSQLVSTEKRNLPPPSKSLPGLKQLVPSQQVHWPTPAGSAPSVQPASVTVTRPQPLPTVRKWGPLTAPVAERNVSVPPIAHIAQPASSPPRKEMIRPSPPSPYHHNEELGNRLSFPPPPVSPETQALNLRFVSSPERPLVKTEPDAEEVVLSSPSSRIRSVQKRPERAKPASASVLPQTTREPLQISIPPSSSNTGIPVAVSFPAHAAPHQLKQPLPPKPKTMGDIYVPHPLPSTSPISPHPSETNGIDLPISGATGVQPRKQTARKTSGNKPRPRPPPVVQYSPPPSPRYRSGSGDSWVAPVYGRSYSPPPLNPRKRGRDFEEESYPAPSRSRHDDQERLGYGSTPSPPPSNFGGLASRLDRQPQWKGDNYVPRYSPEPGFQRGSPPPQDDGYYPPGRPMGRGRAEPPPDLLARMNGNGAPPPRGRGRGRGQPRGRGGPTICLGDRLS